MGCAHAKGKIPRHDVVGLATWSVGNVLESIRQIKRQRLSGGGVGSSATVWPVYFGL